MSWPARIGIALYAVLVLTFIGSILIQTWKFYRQPRQTAAKE